MLFRSVVVVGVVVVVVVGVVVVVVGVVVAVVGVDVVVVGVVVVDVVYGSLQGASIPISSLKNKVAFQNNSIG